MATYQLPQAATHPKLPAKHVYLMANGDLRLSANQNCWAAQEAMEAEITRAVEAAGWKVERAHPYKEDERHGFIGSQKEGMDVFRQLDPNAPLIVAEAVWQYSHHLAARTHDAPRADPHASQLVGHVAGIGGHAESQRLAHQGGRAVLARCGPRTLPTLSSRRNSRSGSVANR